MIIKTLNFRVKDKHIPMLNQQAKEVNVVWNYINNLCYEHTRRTGKFFSTYDIHKYTTGATKAGISLHSNTIQEITTTFIHKKCQFKKTKLKWRITSSSSKKSLGWIPIQNKTITNKEGHLFYQKNLIKLWDSYGLETHNIRSGSFNEDSRGRWYLNLSIQVPIEPTISTTSIGIDLGCSTSATTSTGEKLVGKQYSQLQSTLGKAQRANKKKLVRAIHAKIKNKRKDEQYKFTTKLVQSNTAIFVGDISSSKIIKTKMKLAKSVNDASWYQLKRMLEYKCHQAGVLYEVVNEKFSTQICSCCRVNPISSPKGRADLRIREWNCNNCGAIHDRDVNAAKNILATGHCRLAGGSSLGADVKDCNAYY